MTDHNVQCNPPANLVFLTSRAGGKSREARSHITQLHRRQKKFQTKIPHGHQKKPKSPSRSNSDNPPKAPIPPTITSNPVQCQAYRNGNGNSLMSSNPRECNERQPQAGSYNTIISNRTVISPIYRLQNGCPDPFGTTAVNIDAVMVDLLQYSQQWYIDSKWSLGQILGKQAHSKAVWAMDMRYAICSKAALYSALAVACQYAARLYQKPPAPTPLLKGLHYKILTLKGVREDLQNQPASFYIIQAVVDLAAAEFFATNVTAAWLHLQAAKPMVDALGGLENVNESLRDSIGLTDYVLSWNFLRRPVFLVKDWDPGSWEGQIQIAQSSVCSLAFHPSLKTQSTGDFDSELPTAFLRDAFTELRVTLLVRQLAVLVNDFQCAHRTLRWVHIRTSALYTSLLNHYLDNVGVSQSWKTPTQTLEGQLSGAVCLALRYCHSCTLYTPSVFLNHFPALEAYRKLKNALCGLEQVLIHRQNLSLWLYFVSAVIEELVGTYSLDRHEGSQRAKFQATAESLKLLSSERIRYVLNCFVYTESWNVYLACFTQVP